MIQLLKLTPLLTISALAAAAACAAPSPQHVNEGDMNQARGGKSGDRKMDSTKPINQRFATLDEYLAFLERTQAPVDGPWYRQVRPGVYQLQTGGNLKLDDESPSTQTFTREELEKKLGFR